MILYACIGLGFDGYLWAINSDYKTICTLVFIITLIVAHAIVTIRLNLVMRRLTGDFDKEIRSVNLQFIVFLFAYLVRSAEIVLL